MRCNIDQRGRKARMVSGAVADTVGTVLLFTGFLMHARPLIVASAVLILTGGFMIFEGVKGWCAVRAMGFKTRL